MGKETNFGIPVGKGDFKEAVEEVIKYAKANDIMPRFTVLPKLMLRC